MFKTSDLKKWADKWIFTPFRFDRFLIVKKTPENMKKYTCKCTKYIKCLFENVKLWKWICAKQNSFGCVHFIQPRPEPRLQVRKKNYLHIEKTVSFRFYFRIVLHCSEIYSSVYDLKGTYEFYANYFIQKKLKTFFYFNCFLYCIKPYGVW